MPHVALRRARTGTRPVKEVQKVGIWPIGSIVVPAHNEANVIARTLSPLAKMASSGEIELLVVANGCTDATAAVAGGVRGVAVLEVAEASKTAALNAADEKAVAWPRLYLDADVTVTPTTVRDVLCALSAGELLAARPSMAYSLGEASLLVRSYYRARGRLDETDCHLWGAGTYALSMQGHDRFARFPDILGDDLYVDALFLPSEKAVVRTVPAVVRPPKTVTALQGVMRRVYRGNAELRARGLLDDPQRTTRRVALQLVRSVRGPFSLVDAAVYAALVTLGRAGARRSDQRWERDSSTRRIREVDRRYLEG